MKILFIMLTVLQSLFSALTEKTLQTDFAFTIGAETAQPMTYNGNITMHGELFRANLMDVEVAYDGKTLYTYQEDLSELTLSEPTRQELREANPILFAKDMVDACNVTERELKDGQNVLITLTPKVKDQKTDISRITLRVNKTNLLPLSIEIKEGSKTTTLKTRNPKWINESQSWIIKKDKAYINDLR